MSYNQHLTVELQEKLNFCLQRSALLWICFLGLNISKGFVRLRSTRMVLLKVGKAGGRTRPSLLFSLCRTLDLL